MREIVETVMAMQPSLVAIDGGLSKRRGRLHFRSDQELVVVALDGIHLWQNHLSLFGPEELGCPGEECCVNFFDIQSDSPFLRQFLDNDPIRGCSVGIYDSQNRAVTDSEFERPPWNSF